MFWERVSNSVGESEINECDETEHVKCTSDVNRAWSKKRTFEKIEKTRFILKKTKRMKSKLRHSSTPSAQSTLPPWVFKYCDENLVWFPRTNSMLPDDFPCFGECGNDNYNVIWHYDMLLRLFLATSAPSGDRYAHVSIKVDLLHALDLDLSLPRILNSLRGSTGSGFVFAERAWRETCRCWCIDVIKSRFLVVASLTAWCGCKSRSYCK